MYSSVELVFNVRRERDGERRGDVAPGFAFSASVPRGQAREMVLSLVMNDGSNDVGVFSGDLGFYDRVTKLEVLMHMGVPEDAARAVCGLVPKRKEGN